MIVFLSIHGTEPVYVTITCVRVCVAVQYVPLKAWLFREGFARLSNTRFSLETIDDTCILLYHKARSSSSSSSSSSNNNNNNVRSAWVLVSGSKNLARMVKERSQ